METNEHEHQTIELTSAEISSLWTTYKKETMSICGISYFLMHVKDMQIRQVLEDALALSKKRTERTIQFFNEETYPIPQGFTDHDVNFQAPRLFSDKLYLDYIVNISNLGLAADSIALSFAERSDIIEFYSEALNDTKNAHIEAKILAKEKGIYIRSPLLPKPDNIDFVKKQSFLAGWMGNQRPLLGVEIANLVYASRRNAIGQAVITGFSQVAKSKEVRKYFERGREISGKHLEVFSTILHENYLSDGALVMTSEVTDSTIAPFSDKLMMELITLLIASGIGQYGVAMSVSPRRDLGVTYTRLMAEIANFSNDGAEILIENGWLEQPPMAADRKDLAK